MKIKLFDTPKSLATTASDLLVEEIVQQPDCLLCVATGNTPTATYQQMAQKLTIEQGQELRIIKLDEWGGVSMNHPETCEQYLQKYLVQPLQIPKERYISFNSQSKNPSQEIAKVQRALKDYGGIDICVLGLGTNGHIAFNEPGNQLTPHCHIAELSEKSMQHTMATKMLQKPTHGLTLGMTDILQSKIILMLITGSHKKEITKAFLAKKITTQLPASFLWLHPNVYCFVDKAAYGLGKEGLNT